MDIGKSSLEDPYFVWSMGYMDHTLTQDLEALQRWGENHEIPGNSLYNLLVRRKGY